MYTGTFSDLEHRTKGVTDIHVHIMYMQSKDKI